MTILQRGPQGSSRHVHSYRATPAVAGFLRQVCTDCQHVSIDSPDSSIPNAARSQKTGLFGAPPPRLGLAAEELLPRTPRGRSFGLKADPA